MIVEILLKKSSDVPDSPTCPLADSIIPTPSTGHGREEVVSEGEPAQQTVCSMPEQIFTPSQRPAPSSPPSISMDHHEAEPLSYDSFPDASTSPTPASMYTPLFLTPEGAPPHNMSEKPIVRRDYHPNPAKARSEWMLWCRNIPSDATHDELWDFVSNLPGVLSIFLVLRSNCAFITYESEAELQAAIAMFNGVPLRPNDPRCPRLIFRARKKDDDLIAGVGVTEMLPSVVAWVRDPRAGDRLSCLARTIHGRGQRRQIG